MSIIYRLPFIKNIFILKLLANIYHSYILHIHIWFQLVSLKISSALAYSFYPMKSCDKIIDCIVIIMMPREVREEELYEDLSIMLQLIKKKLAMLIRPVSPSHSEQSLQSYEQQQTDNLLTGFRLKYATFSCISPLIMKTIERFFCRVKQIISQLLTKIPRQKLYLIRTLKEIEQLTVRPLNQYNHLAIISFLDLIMAVKQSKSSLSLSSLGKQQRRRIDILASIQGNHLQPIAMCGQRVKKVTEVQTVQKNAQIYHVMDIDVEHIRGRYFDFKNDERANVQSEMTYRNRYIRQIISSFSLEYERYKRKDPNGRSKKLFCRFQKRYDRWETLESISLSSKRIENLTPAQFNRTPKAANETKNRNDSHYSSAFDKKNRENKMEVDSFRSLFEEKLNEKKQNIKIKNMIINLHEAEGKIKGKGLNEKRLQFYKKSQQQIKLRYKYYNYSYKSASASKSSIKYRTINPESTFNTIDS